MKKLLSIVIMAVLLATSVSAQENKCQFTLNTRAWSTNYWTTILYGIAQSAVVHWALDDNPVAEAIIPLSTPTTSTAPIVVPSKTPSNISATSALVSMPPA